MATYTGSCHCNAILVNYETRRVLSKWPLRACQCSFCRRHGVLSTSDPNGSAAFQAADPSFLMRYRFGMKSADFLICAACGVYVGTQMTTPAGRMAVLNARCLLIEEAKLPKPQSMRYEAETPETRMARRQARWTPVAVGSL